MPWLEDVANVALRVPCLLALDQLFKCDVESFTEHIKARNEDMLFKYKYIIWNVYYTGESAHFKYTTKLKPVNDSLH